MVSPASLLVAPDKFVAVAAAQDGEHQRHAAYHGSSVIHRENLPCTPVPMVTEPNRVQQLVAQCFQLVRIKGGVQASYGRPE